MKPNGWRLRANVRRRHRLMIYLRRRRKLYLKEIAVVIGERYGEPLDTSTIVFHLMARCQCGYRAEPAEHRGPTAYVRDAAERFPTGSG
mgnify:CR=1 FL=1